MAEFYPGVPFKRETAPNETLLSIENARRELGTSRNTAGAKHDCVIVQRIEICLQSVRLPGHANDGKRLAPYHHRRAERTLWLSEVVHTRVCL